MLSLLFLKYSHRVRKREVKEKWGKNNSQNHVAKFFINKFYSRPYFGPGKVWEFFIYSWATSYCHFNMVWGNSLLRFIVTQDAQMHKVHLLFVHFFLEKHINWLTSKNDRYVPVFFQGFSLNLMKSEKNLFFCASHIIFSFFLSEFASCYFHFSKQTEGFFFLCVWFDLVLGIFQCFTKRKATLKIKYKSALKDHIPQFHYTQDMVTMSLLN